MYASPMGSWHGRVAGLAVPFLALAGVVLVMPNAAPAQYPGPEIVKKLNEQRRGIGVRSVTEDPAWTDGCQKHNIYLAGRPPGDDHEEGVEDPLFTSEGLFAGRNSVLGRNLPPWERVANPFVIAPFHFAQLLAPRLLVTGASEDLFVDPRDGRSERRTCVNTLAGRTRTPPKRVHLYAYPPPGSKLLPTLNAEPRTVAGVRPGELGLFIYIWADGPWASNEVPLVRLSRLRDERGRRVPGVRVFDTYTVARRRARASQTGGNPSGPGITTPYGMWGFSCPAGPVADEERERSKRNLELLRRSLEGDFFAFLQHQASIAQEASAKHKLPEEWTWRIPSSSFEICLRRR